MKLTQSRLVLIGIFALFFLPVLAALILRVNPVIVDTVNRGVLIDPPRSVSGQGLQVQKPPMRTSALFTKEWTVLTLWDGACEADCMQELYQTRQARAATNKDMTRIQRLLVLPSAAPAELLRTLEREHPDIAVAHAPDAWRSSYSQGLPEGARTSMVDPRGFLFIAYAAPIQAGDLLKDLKRLLKISAID